MEDTKRAPRRSHSAELKARVLGECSQQGASIAKVALAHGLNANLVHKWRRAAEAATTRFTALAHTRDSAGAFIALALSLAVRVAALMATVFRTPLIQVDAVWLAVQPIDMRCGADRLLASVVRVFGAAQAHHG